MLPGARRGKRINLIQPVSPVAELIRLLPVPVVVFPPLPRAATGTKTHFLSEYDEGVTIRVETTWRGRIKFPYKIIFPRKINGE